MKPRNHHSSSWSWSVGSVAGVDLYLHATFLVLLGWIALSHLLAGHGLVAAAAGLIVIAAVFGSVLLHELGHALAARRYGIGTRDITLLPIGGVARLERMPSEPRQELIVALAGPAVNVALALVTLLLVRALNAPWSPEVLALVGGPLLAKILWINVTLAVFNLLPAFPMDGGRVLRALLAMRMGRVRATDIAARVGQGMAIAFGLVGLLGHPMLVFVAFFVWVGAAEEAALVHAGAALESMHVRDAMVTEFESLPTHAPVAYGVDRVLHGVQREFPVVDGDRLVGVVGAGALIQAAAEGRSHVAVSAVAQPIGATALPAEPVEVALERMEHSGSEFLPVIESDRLVGLVRSQNVLALAALREPRTAPA
ncbi:site-2 protease family protein [Sorangium sp. So ce1182]|uniref:site-2 protease family protein n=1 Tax=Sorangium sp. So ce1182 TaxID=3133334 RepID=UPI003F60739A